MADKKRVLNKLVGLRRQKAEQDYLAARMEQEALAAEAERLTGLQVGGIGALALLHKGWDAILDASALDQAAILVSAGQRGINLKVPVEPLIKVLDARTAHVTAAG